MKRTRKSVAASLAVLVLVSSPGWQSSSVLAQTVAQAPGGVAGLPVVPAGVGSRLNNSVSLLPAPSLAPGLLRPEMLGVPASGAVSGQDAGALSVGTGRSAVPLAKSGQASLSPKADEVPAAQTLGPAVRTEGSRRASWDAWTNRLIFAAGFVFSLLLVPQIAKNFINLSAGHAQALSALSWTGFATNVLANALYLGYFRAKKEHSRAVIQLIGLLAGTVVLGQMLLAGVMPLTAFIAVTAVVGLDLGFNFLAYKGRLSARVAPLDKALQTAAGLTGTLLFMFGPVAALVAMALHPADIAGIALGSVVLGLVGDMLLSPRLMLTKDALGLSSNLWSVVLAGVARLVWMYVCGNVPALLFWPMMILVPAYFAFAAVMNHRRPFDASPRG